MVDDSTFKQLKESNHYFPEVTEVIYDSDKMLEMGSVALKSIVRGFDIVWDRLMFTFVWKYFKDGMMLAENQARNKGIKFRLIVEITKENVDLINSIKYYDIRHIDNLRGNFAIFDNRAYMVQIFHDEKDQPVQALFSNVKELVAKQEKLFEKLWDIAIPLALRVKEIEYEEKSDYHKTITNFEDVQSEIVFIIEQCKKDLLIFSSIKILSSILNRNNFISKIESLLKKEVNIKILTDGIDKYFVKQFELINGMNKNSYPIQLGYTNKLGNFHELVITNDSKYMLQVKYDQENRLVASFSNSEHMIYVQEILFEKYWNEIKSLEITNRQ